MIHVNSIGVLHKNQWLVAATHQFITMLGQHQCLTMMDV